MIHHLSPPTGLEPGTSSFTRVSPYTLLYHKKPFPKPLQFACAHNCKHILQRSLRPLIGGQKVTNLAEFFMVDARILYVLVVKISGFFLFVLKFMCHFKSSTCSISMANFQAWFRPRWWSHLDLSFIHKINLTKSSF
jgi:hypothetical protein